MKKFALIGAFAILAVSSVAAVAAPNWYGWDPAKCKGFPCSVIPGIPEQPKFVPEFTQNTSKVCLPTKSGTYTAACLHSVTHNPVSSEPATTLDKGALGN